MKKVVAEFAVKENVNNSNKKSYFQRELWRRFLHFCCGPIRRSDGKVTTLHSTMKKPRHSECNIDKPHWHKQKKILSPTENIGGKTIQAIFRIHFENRIFLTREVGIIILTPPFVEVDAVVAIDISVTRYWKMLCFVGPMSNTVKRIGT